MKRTTIKDIAKRLDVNPSTVSRALKDHPDIGAALRLEIHRLAEEMHYRPNHLAMRLRQRSSRLIGLIVPEVTMFFYPSVIKGIQHILHEKHYQLLMLLSDESPERELENISICADNEVAGILISVSRETQLGDHIDLLHDIAIPIVVFDKILESLPYDSVILEDEASASFAVKHLIKTGCKNIGGIFGNPNLLITQSRVQGYRKALEECGLPFREEFVYFANDTPEAEACTKLLLAHDPLVEGIFAMTDEIIIGVMSAITQSNLKIPEECSIICISDGFLPYCLHPKVTFLHHDGLEVGKLAALKILSLIEAAELNIEPKNGEKNMIQAQLIELSTTRPIKVSR